MSTHYFSSPEKHSTYTYDPSILSLRNSSRKDSKKLEPTANNKSSYNKIISPSNLM